MKNVKVARVRIVEPRGLVLPLHRLPADTNVMVFGSLILEYMFMKGATEPIFVKAT